MNCWPPKPGFTVMIRIRSISGTISDTALSGVAGFSATPARPPSSRIRLSWRWGGCWVDREAAGPGGHETVEEPFGLDHHEMDVERQRRQPPHRLDDLRAESEIRHEAAVHDVDVDPVGAAGLAQGDLFAEPREV